MPRAPRFWGPRAFGGPALTLFYFFSEFFVPCFSAGAKQCARAPKSLSPPENSRPQKIGPKRVFFVPCFSVSARGPKEPKVLRKRYNPQNLKIEAPKCGAPNDFFVPCFSAGSKQRGAPRRQKFIWTLSCLANFPL